MRITFQCQFPIMLTICPRYGRHGLPNIHLFPSPPNIELEGAPRIKFPSRGCALPGRRGRAGHVSVALTNRSRGRAFPISVLFFPHASNTVWVQRGGMDESIGQDRLRPAQFPRLTRSCDAFFSFFFSCTVYALSQAPERLFSKLAIETRSWVSCRFPTRLKARGWRWIGYICRQEYIQHDVCLPAVSSALHLHPSQLCCENAEASRPPSTFSSAGLSTSLSHPSLSLLHKKLTTYLPLHPTYCIAHYQ